MEHDADMPECLKPCRESLVGVRREVVGVEDRSPKKPQLDAVGVRCRHQQPPTWLQNPSNLGQSLVHIHGRQVLDEFAGDHGIERTPSEGQACCVRHKSFVIGVSWHVIHSARNTVDTGQAHIRNRETTLHTSSAVTAANIQDSLTTVSGKYRANCR